MNKNKNKKDWTKFQIVSIVVLIIIIILNVVGTLVAMSVVGQMGNKPVLNDNVTAKNMPYTEDTPYEIYRKPANPNEGLIIK